MILEEHKLSLTQPQNTHFIQNCRSLFLVLHCPPPATPTYAGLQPPKPSPQTALRVPMGSLQFPLESHWVSKIIANFQKKPLNPNPNPILYRLFAAKRQPSPQPLGHSTLEQPSQGEVKKAPSQYQATRKPPQTNENNKNNQTLKNN